MSLGHLLPKYAISSELRALPRRHFQRFSVSVLLASIPVIAIAGDGGIEEASSRVSVFGENSIIGESIGLSGEARFPVGSHTGLWIDAEESSFSGNDFYADSSTKIIGFGMLARKYDLGILQASYHHGEAEAYLNPTRKYKAEIYSLFGSYYAERNDASLSYSRTDLDAGSSIDSYGIGVP